MEDTFTKIQQETIEFRAEIRNLFQIVVTQQEEAKLAQEMTDEKLDAHIQKVEPILEALAFSKTAAVIVKWSSGLLITAGTAYLLAKQVIRGY